MSRRTAGRPRDEGSGTVLTLCVVVLALVLAQLAAALGSVVQARHRAFAAADLAALAAAGRDPPSCPRAREVARRNGAALVGCTVAADGSVTVEVAVRVAAPAGESSAMPFDGVTRALGAAVGRARAGVP